VANDRSLKSQGWRQRKLKGDEVFVKPDPWSAVTPRMPVRYLSRITDKPHAWSAVVWIGAYRESQ